LTGPACYSRFFRNGPLVAKDRGESYEKDWYLHMKGPVSIGEEQAGEAGTFHEDKRVAEQAGGSKGEDEKASEKVVGQAGVSREAMTEIVRTVEHEKRMFWEHVAEVVNAKMVDEAPFTEEEVKDVYDRMKASGA